jgi:hypothetical protein
MTLDEVILELYRLAESRQWNAERSDEAMVVSIEALEQIWMLKQEDRRRSAKANANRRQTRVWC